jgi:flagellar biosynthesis GTPase FlhF
MPTISELKEQIKATGFKYALSNKKKAELEAILAEATSRKSKDEKKVENKERQSKALTQLQQVADDTSKRNEERKKAVEVATHDNKHLQRAMAEHKHEQAKALGAVGTGEVKLIPKEEKKENLGQMFKNLQTNEKSMPEGLTTALGNLFWRRISVQDVPIKLYNMPDDLQHLYFTVSQGGITDDYFDEKDKKMSLSTYAPGVYSNTNVYSRVDIGLTSDKKIYGRIGFKDMSNKGKLYIPKGKKAILEKINDIGMVMMRS